MDFIPRGTGFTQTIDFTMQKAAEERYNNGIILWRRGQKRGPGALIAMEISTGRIKAMVGGSDFWINQFNRATHALRSPALRSNPCVLDCDRTWHERVDLVADCPLH